MAAYQYSITCCVNSEQHRVVLKRKYLLDTFVSPFYPFFLKAADAKVAVQMINSCSEWNDLTRDAIVEDIPDIDGVYEHKEVNICEALVEVENTKLRVEASSKIEFINARSNLQSVFKKAKNESENLYKVEGNESVLYELQETYLSRFTKSLNSEDMLLCEFVVHYDFVGNDKTENLFSVFADRLDKIEESDTKSILGDGNLPEMVLCSNHQVMRKRRSPKILKFPDFEEDTFDFKHNLVLLFSKIPVIDGLTPEDVEAAFNETDENGEKLIIRNRR